MSRGFGMRAARHAALVCTVVLSMVSAVVSPPVFAASAAGHALPIPQDKAVPVTPVKSAYRNAPVMPAWSAQPVTWPSGSADLAVTASSPSSRAALPLVVRPAGPTAP